MISRFVFPIVTLPTGGINRVVFSKSHILLLESFSRKRFKMEILTHLITPHIYT